jgi:hypothetical protein
MVNETALGGKVEVDEKDAPEFLPWLALDLHSATEAALVSGSHYGY